MLATSPNFFSTAAQVIPTLLIAVFLTDLATDAERRRATLANTEAWSRHPVRSTLVVVALVGVLFGIAFVEIGCVNGAADGGPVILAVTAGWLIWSLLVLLIYLVVQPVLENAPRRTHRRFNQLVVNIGYVGTAWIWAANWHAVWASSWLLRLR